MAIFRRVKSDVTIRTPLFICQKVFFRVLIPIVVFLHQKREEDKLKKIKETDKSDALAALENFESYKKEKEVQQTQKMDVVTDNREKKLREVKEKMQQRERRAEEVRRRKQQALEQGLVTSGIIDNQTEYPQGVINSAYSQ